MTAHEQGEGFYCSYERIAGGIWRSPEQPWIEQTSNCQGYFSGAEKIARENSRDRIKGRERISVRDNSKNSRIVATGGPVVEGVGLGTSWNLAWDLNLLEACLSE